MSDFQRRQELQSSLIHALGQEPADTLIAMLPPYPWDEIATTFAVLLLGLVAALSKLL